MNARSNITGGPADEIFRARIMGKYDVTYFRCRETGYIQAKEPHWLPEAYASPMNLTDTGVLSRNARFVSVVGSVLNSLFDNDQRFLDYAGGYGIFTRMMRDVGFDYYWDDRFTKNLCARGFEYHPAAFPIEAVTAFEVFEHLPNPTEEISTMLGLSKNLIFSTELLPNPTPRPNDWWYYGLEHGQHVSFYTVAALEHIAKSHQLRLVTNKENLHMFVGPNVVPKRIEARWFRQWLQHTSAVIRQSLKASYQFVPFPHPASGIVGRLKRIYHRKRFPGFYVLRSRTPETLAGILKTPIAIDYLTHLLVHGSRYWPWMLSQMKPRVFDDMIHLKAKTLSPQTLPIAVNDSH